VVSSSSTKRAARLAQKGKGKKVRFQGGTIFPLVVLGVLVAGVILIGYARFSRPDADASPPTVDDHWHVAYGFQLCGTEGTQMLQGAKEERDANQQLVSVEYLRTGVHSHDDGVIHWHAFTSAATGANATLGTFLDVYGVDLSNDELHFPDDQQGGASFVEGETMCGDEDGKLVVAVWDNFTDTGDPTIYTAAFNDIRIDQDSMVIVVAYIPENVDAREAVTMPPWAAELPALGAVDGGTGANSPILAGAGTAPIGETQASVTGTPGTGTTEGSTDVTTDDTTSATATTGG
jgi:hypothetical protein